jgi:hypothetical protein
MTPGGYADRRGVRFRERSAVRRTRRLFVAVLETGEVLDASET